MLCFISIYSFLPWYLHFEGKLSQLEVLCELLFCGESHPVLLVRQEGRSDSLHLSKHSLAVTLERVSPWFFSQADGFCHCCCPAGEVPQLDAGEKTNKALKLPPPSPTSLAPCCQSELLLWVGELWLGAGQHRHQLLSVPAHGWAGTQSQEQFVLLELGFGEPSRPWSGN